VPTNRPDGANYQSNGLDCVSAGSYDTGDMCDIEDCDIHLSYWPVQIAHTTASQPCLFPRCFEAGANQGRAQKLNKAPKALSSSSSWPQPSWKAKVHKSKVKVSSLARLTSRSAPCFELVLACFGSLSCSDLKIGSAILHTPCRRAEVVEMSP
jgi:hypothetical protein